MPIREILGIVGISLTLGMLAVGLIGVGTNREDVKLVSATVPDLILRSVGARPVLSVGLLCGRGMEELRLRFATLSEADPATWYEAQTRRVREEDLATMPTGLTPLDVWLRHAEGLGHTIAAERAEALINDTVYHIYLYDFRDLSGSAPCMNVFALAFNNGNLTKAYWGYGDFFIGREATVISLMLECGRGGEVYSTNPKGEERFVGELPAKGQFALKHLLRDDQVFVTMALEGYQVPLRKSWLWACEANVDGSTTTLWVFSIL